MLLPGATMKWAQRWIHTWRAASVFVAIVTVATSASAAEPRSMSLVEARSHARSHHQRVIAARRHLAASRAEAEVPGAQWLPRIGAMAQLVGSTANNSTATILGASAVDLPRIGGTSIVEDPSFVPHATTMVAVGIRQEIFDFGRIAAEKTALRLAADAQDLAVRDAELDVDLGVEQGYLAVLAAAAVEDAARGAYDRASAHRDFARANVASGLRPPIELTRAEADVGRYEVALTRARAGVHVARSVFAAAVGVEDAELDAKPDEVRTGALPPLAAYLAGVNATPRVRRAEARVAAQRAETRRLGAQTRPRISATAAISGRGGGAEPSSGPDAYGDGWLPSVPNYGAGVVFTWPLVEPIWSRREDASRAREAAFEGEVDLEARAQRAQVIAAYHRASAAAVAIAALQRGAAAARDNYAQAENRFRVGVGTSTELADAQALMTEADIQLAIGRYEVARTRTALERAAAEVR